MLNSLILNALKLDSRILNTRTNALFFSAHTSVAEALMQRFGRQTPAALVACEQVLHRENLLRAHVDCSWHRWWHKCTHVDCGRESLRSARQRQSSLTAATFSRLHLVYGQIALPVAPPSPLPPRSRASTSIRWRQQPEVVVWPSTYS